MNRINGVDLTTKYSDEAYKLLANAIIVRAADDWWIARNNIDRLEKKLKTVTDHEKRGYIRRSIVSYNSTLIDCTKFFESEWAFMLSRGLSDVIFENLQNLYIRYNGSFKRYKRYRYKYNIYI